MRSRDDDLFPFCRWGNRESWKLTDFPRSHRKWQSRDLNPEVWLQSLGSAPSLGQTRRGQLMDSGWTPSRQGEMASPRHPAHLPSSFGIPPLSRIHPALEPGPPRRNTAYGLGWRPLLWAKALSSLSECGRSSGPRAVN